MKHAVVMVVRDEEYYIDMAIKSVVANTDHIFVLDTGSTDNTANVIKDADVGYGKTVVEQRDFGGAKDDNGTLVWHAGYRELEARNYALRRAIDLFDPDWVTFLDADEILNDVFFANLQIVMARGKNAIGCATEMPISFDKISRDVQDMVLGWHGHDLHDPHVRTWNRRRGEVSWGQNEGCHVHLQSTTTTGPDCFINEPVHFHLHHSFGPKSLPVYVERWNHGEWSHTWIKGYNPEPYKNVEYYKSKYPHLFDSGKFKVSKQYIENVKHVVLPERNKLPQYVVDKWNDWAVYV